MFSKFIKSIMKLELSDILKSNSFHNSTIKTTTNIIYPLLFKVFPNINDHSSFFIIKQLEETELDEAVLCISEAFSAREVIMKNFKIQKEQILKKVRKDLEKALASNLCLVCKEQNSRKLAGLVYYEDLSDTVDPNIWQESSDISNENWSNLLEFYNYCFSVISPGEKPSVRNDVMMIKKLAVAQEFTKLGVASNLIFAGRYIHPRTTKAKKTLMIVSNKKTYEFMLIHGWEIIKEVNLKDYKKGSISKKGEVYLIKYEQKYVKTIIEELKSFF